MECLGVSFGMEGGDTFDLGGGFLVVMVEIEVDDLELEVGVVIKLAWGCLNGRLCFL